LCLDQWFTWHSL